MQTRQIDPKVSTVVDSTDAILFLLPFGCKTYRVIRVSEYHKQTGNYQHIIDILNAICRRKVGDMWFFPVSDRDMLDDTVLTLVESLNVDAVYVEQDQPYGIDKSGNKIQSILN